MEATEQGSYHRYYEETGPPKSGPAQPPERRVAER